jgi:hypothetical protein
MQEPPILLELLVGNGAVGVDRVDDLLGQPLQILRAELVGEPGEQFLTGLDGCGVEPGPVHPGQGPGHDVDLFRSDLPVPLRRGQLRPDGASPDAQD